MCRNHLTELVDRIARFVSENSCSCTSTSNHFDKLDALSNSLPDNLDTSITVLKAISEDNRLTILNLFVKTTLCACELEYMLDISQPTVTYHLQILRKAGLIVMEREGKWTSIKLANDNIVSLLEIIQSLEE